MRLGYRLFWVGKKVEGRYKRGSIQVTWNSKKGGGNRGTEEGTVNGQKGRYP